MRTKTRSQSEAKVGASGGPLDSSSPSAARYQVAPWVRDALVLFGVSRVAFVLVTYVGYILIQAPKYSAQSVGVAGVYRSWDQWDALRYLYIAAHGYTATRGYSGASLTAFFPLYPVLIGILTAPFHGHGTYTVGLLLSNLAFCGALLLLRPLVATRWGDSVADRSVLCLTIFPTALYTFAPYNESLFLLFSLACFLCLERRRWALAGALGALAVLTRAAGILLLIPFAYEWWRARRGDGSSSALTISDPQSVARASPLNLLWALLIPAGLGLYAAYCGTRFGDPLSFMHAQVHWNRELTWPWLGLWWQVVGLAQAAPASFFQVHDLVDLSATVLFLALLVGGWRKLPRAQSLYFGALLLLIVSEPGGVGSHLQDALSSNARFVLEMFPGFIVLALWLEERPRWQQPMTLTFTTLLATLSVVFILGRWLV